MTDINRSRPDWDEYFMGFAHVASARATCDRKHVGAVVVVDKQVVATGYNGSVVGMPHCNDREHVFVSDQDETWCMYCKQVRSSPHLDEHCSEDSGDGHDLQDGHCVRTIHAEMNALAQAARHGVRVEGGTIYTTASPCWDCFRVLVNAGLRRFIYAEPYRADEHEDRIQQVVDRHTGLEVACIDGNS